MKKPIPIQAVKATVPGKLSGALFALGCLLLLSGCIGKNVDIDVSQRGCSLFQISSPTTQVVDDPSCTGSPLVATYDITFTYTGNEACLHRIVLEPATKVSDAAGNRIPDASYATEFIDTSALVTIDAAQKKVTFRLIITFPDADAASSLNNVYVVFHCENTEGLSSSAAKVQIMSECGVPPAGIGEPIKTITVRDSIVRVRLWDNAEEDGDIVSVYLNGTWVLRDFMLTNAQQTFNWPIRDGQPNDLTLVANNQGSVGPNTVSISINGRWSTSLDLDLETGAVIRIL